MPDGPGCTRAVATLTVPACLQPAACAGPASTSPCTDTRPRVGMRRKRVGVQAVPWDLHLRWVLGFELGPKCACVQDAGVFPASVGRVEGLRSTWSPCVGSQAPSSGWGSHERGGGCWGGRCGSISTLDYGHRSITFPFTKPSRPAPKLNIATSSFCLLLTLLAAPLPYPPFFIFLSMTSSKPSMRERGD